MKIITPWYNKPLTRHEHNQATPPSIPSIPSSGISNASSNPTHDTVVTNRNMQHTSQSNPNHHAVPKRAHHGRNISTTLGIPGVHPHHRCRRPHRHSPLLRYHPHARDAQGTTTIILRPKLSLVMRLHLMIPCNHLRVTRRRRTPVARPSRGGALLLWLVLLLLLVLGRGSSSSIRSRRGARGPVVHVASSSLRLVGGLRVLLLLVALLLGLCLGLALAVTAVVDEDVDAAVLGVLGEVVVVVGRFGVLGDDVPCVEEAWEL